SVFNSDVVARAELLAGGFGAEHGGRVSSVLNVETQPDTGGLGGAMGVSLLASRVALHASLPKGVAGVLGGKEGSWLVSARRSYFDAILAAAVDFPYHLTDFQLGAVLGTAGGGRVRLTAYTGEDVLDLSDFDPPGDDDDVSILRLRWNWGNDVLGVRWEQPVGGAWVADTRLGFTRYGEALGFTDFADTRFGSRIEQLTLRTDLGRALGPELTVKTGAELSRTAYANFGEAGGTSFYDAARSGVLATGYGQLRWSRSQAWILEPGLRADAWTAGGHTRVHLSPRLAVKRFFGAQRDGAVKLAVGRYVQFVHSLRDEQLPVSNDTWVTADENVPAVVSDQVQLGVEKFWGDTWYASLEGYYRAYHGVTDFNIAENPNDIADDLLEGEGYSYGVDLLVRRTAGRLTGWTTLSLLKAERTFPDPTVPEGLEGAPTRITFPPIFDRRVDVDVVLQYLLPWGIESGLRWNFGSGVPYSRPVAQFVGFATDVIEGGYRVPRPITEDANVPYYIVPGERNRQRYPAYHRLDVTFRKTYTRRWGTLTPYLQVLNAYNRRNVLFYFFDYNQAPPTRSGISMFPVLPTIGLEATF
ncbi:MAG TPA: TonB-dependent receptor, partial [Longimicrobiaceae bacterium]|nr:TonB-dependent receptor [Longimicrobiaceae bacterium]